MGAGEPRSSLISDFSSSPLHLSENKILHYVQNDIVVPVTLREAKSL